MSKKRKLHHLTGSINYCWLGTSKSKTYKNQPFYYLDITHQNDFGTKLETIYVLSNLVSKSIWQVLENESYRTKKYLFICEKRTRGWRLRDWQEL